MKRNFFKPLYSINNSFIPELREHWYRWRNVCRLDLHISIPTELKPNSDVNISINEKPHDPNAPEIITHFISTLIVTGKLNHPNGKILRTIVENIKNKYKIFNEQDVVGLLLTFQIFKCDLLRFVSTRIKWEQKTLEAALRSTNYENQPKEYSDLMKDLNSFKALSEKGYLSHFAVMGFLNTSSNKQGSTLVSGKWDNRFDPIEMQESLEWGYQHFFDWYIFRCQYKNSLNLERSEYIEFTTVPAIVSSDKRDNAQIADLKKFTKLQVENWVNVYPIDILPIDFGLYLILSLFRDGKNIPPAVNTPKEMASETYIPEPNLTSLVPDESKVSEKSIKEHRPHTPAYGELQAALNSIIKDSRYTIILDLHKGSKPSKKSLELLLDILAEEYLLIVKEKTVSVKLNQAGYADQDYRKPFKKTKRN